MHLFGSAAGPHMASFFGALALFSFTTAAHARSLEVVATGLDNPRGISLRDDDLFVTEAGRGGNGPCVTNSRGQYCFGKSGAIGRLHHKSYARVLSGLDSLVQVNGEEIYGPSDISFVGPHAFVIMNLGLETTSRAALGSAGQSLGHILRIDGLLVPHCAPSVSVGADISAFETTHDPYHETSNAEALFTNPYAIVASPWRRVVADAAGNDLLVESARGIETLAVFPDRMVDAPPFLGLPPGTKIPMQAVPDSVTIGPDGAYYVGALSGFPFPVGAALIYRVVPGSEPEVFATGFTNVIGVAFGRDSSMYVLEHARSGLLNAGNDPFGRLTRIAHDGTRSVLSDGELTRPTSLAVDDDGSVFVANFGTSTGGGQIVHIKP